MERGRGRPRGRGRGRALAVREGLAQAEQATHPDGGQQGVAEQILAGITQIFDRVAGGAPLDLFTVAYHEFLRHRTPRYDGSGGYDAAEEWLLGVQDTFRIASTPVEHWTEIAATRFDRDARHWWATQQPQLQGDGPIIPWEQFTDAFRAHFMGSTQLEELRSSFETLTQGTMTARQYGEAILRLSRYAPDLVTDPQRRRDRFIRGLIPDLVIGLDSYQSLSIEYLMDKAVFQESILAARERSRRDQLRSGGLAPRRATVPPPRQPTAPVFRRPGMAITAPGGGTSQGGRYFCAHCQRHHIGPCTRLSGGCHLCQATDHWMADCPRNTGRTLSGSGSSSRG